MTTEPVVADAFEVLERIQNCQSAQAVYEVFGEYIRQFGFNHFLITDLPPPSFHLEPHVILSGWEEAWYKHYMAARYYEHDPIAQHTQRITQPFVWSEYLATTKLSRQAQQVMNEGAEFGLKDGMSVPLLGSNGLLTCVTMGGEHLELSPRSKAALNMISIYAHHMAQQYRKKSPELQYEAKPSLLTPREKEIMHWVAMGKTDTEIAIICGIKPRTAFKHVKSTAIKLKAVNRTQAVVQALLTGEISP